MTRPGTGAAPPAAVPAGPGVRPPFAAAPVEGRTARVWLGLGVAGAVLVLCCGAGIASLGGLAVTSMQAITEQAQRPVDDYLSARVDGEWEDAYEQRCDEDRQDESLAQYIDRVSAPPQIESYDLGEIDIGPRGDFRGLRAVIDYADGSTERLTVPLSQDPETGQFEVCGLER